MGTVKSILQLGTVVRDIKDYTQWIEEPFRQDITLVSFFSHNSTWWISVIGSAFDVETVTSISCNIMSLQYSHYTSSFLQTDEAHDPGLSAVAVPL